MSHKRSLTSPRSLPGSLSVQDVCDFDLLRDTRVLAGGKGMDRRVQRLNVMTVPDIAQWTKPDELLLATGFPLSRGTNEMISLVRELNACGVAALAVKLGDYGAVLDTAVLEAADALDLPIIAVPEEVAFDDILSEVLAALTNRQAAALSRAQEAHEALLRISLEGGGLDRIVQELSRVLEGLGVICLDTAGHVLAENMTDAQWHELRERGLLGTSGSLTRIPVLAAGSDPYASTLVAAQISAGELRHGYLLAVSADTPLDQEVEMMVEQAAMVAALDISRDLAVSAVSRRFEASAIHSLLAGSAEEIQEVAQRSDAFGWDLSRPLVVLAGRRPRPPDRSEDTMRREHDIRSWLTAVRGADRQAAAGLLGRNFVAICGAPERPESLALNVSEHLTGATRARFFIGLSDTVDNVVNLPRAYQHARMAVEFGQREGTSGSVTSYESLGLFRLLNAVADRRELEAFVAESIGPVLELPTAERDDMLRTLDVLYATRMNVAEASRVLHYHYNTLRYRIRKLEQLLGDFTRDSQLELRITVALQITKMWSMTD